MLLKRLLRGAYCAATLISLLSLPLELHVDAPARAKGLNSLLDGLPQYVSRCTYQSSLAHRVPTKFLQVKPSRVVFQVDHRVKLKDHTLSVRLLVCASSGPLMRCCQRQLVCFAAHKARWLTPSRYLDLPLLVSWLSARQYAPEGGFSGRTNKLVDGCYSHWVGGCWPLISAALSRPQIAPALEGKYLETLFSEEGLIRYIMSCCQNDEGGLRDKPDV